MESPTRTAAVDSRPSDAINLALVAGAPIEVDESVLEAAQQNEHCRSILEPTAAERTYPEGRAEIAADAIA